MNGTAGKRVMRRSRPYFGPIQKGAEPYVPDFPYFLRNGEGRYLRALAATFTMNDADMLASEAVQSIVPLDFDAAASKQAIYDFMAAESARLGILNPLPAGSLKD
jgi:hypothetical protein